MQMFMTEARARNLALQIAKDIPSPRLISVGVFSARELETPGVPNPYPQWAYFCEMKEQLNGGQCATKILSETHYAAWIAQIAAMTREKEGGILA